MNSPTAEERPTNAGRAARALWHVSPGRAELRVNALRAPGGGEILARTLFSAISRGTERLVFNGRVPESEYAAMRGPMQEGDFPYPVKYGYCAVARIEAGPRELVGRTIFALHPHQDFFVAPASMIALVPDATPPERAVLAPNMETALNALWDSGAGPGDRIAIVGGGAVGLLTAFLAAGLPGAEVALVDPEVSRAAIAEALGARFSTDGDAVRDADIVFHASATPAGLAAAIAACGNEARLVEMSWYGDRAIEAPLGGAFHARRLQIVASQVGQVSPSRRPRWSHARRLAKALDLLADSRLDMLIGERIPFSRLADEMPRLLTPGAPGVAPLVVYD
ncbi:MAG TPA: zinc-binding alcohol dehydrogenase [Rhodoblastus sp.]|nr:zinc-binding alcohol dehydrogenase [Rhodoblastus sp.]